MKFSESLLKDSEIGCNIFDNSVNKAKVLLSEIFELDFINSDKKIVSINENSDNYFFEVIFSIDDREIKALLNYEKINDDILSEVLIIKELHNFNIPIQINDNDYSFNNIINKAMDYLEEKYDIDFTPIDPEAKDKNIYKIVSDVKNNIWEVLFISSDYEAIFKAEYNNDKKPYLKILQNNNHIIYLD